MWCQEMELRKIETRNSIVLGFPATWVTVVAMPCCQERQAMQKDHKVGGQEVPDCKPSIRRAEFNLARRPLRKKLFAGHRRGFELMTRHQQTIPI